MTVIIDGKKIANEILSNLKNKIIASKRKPKLSILLIGNNPASTIYVSNKMRQAASIGISTELITSPITIDTKSILSTIHHLNSDPSTNGIIVQLPVPTHINLDSIIEGIDPQKDVDGFHPINVGRLHSAISAYDKYFVPCTALAALHAIQSTTQDLAGKHAVIINRSNLIGKPLAALLLQHNMTVTTCHSHSLNLKEITKTADVAICATGKPKFFDKSYFKKDTIIIDVGISRETTLNKEYIVGDVNYEDLLGHASYITPVPGGIGPMTIAYLLSNTCKFLI